MAVSSLTFQQLEHQYGELLRSAPLCECISARVLHGILIARDPPVDVSLQSVQTWWDKYNIPAGAETASSALELEERYGDGIRHFAYEYPTSFKLRKALREQETPLCVTDKVARVWLQKYAHRGEVRSIQNAGHLETLRRAHTLGGTIRCDRRCVGGVASQRACCICAAEGMPDLSVTHLELFGAYHDERCS